MNTDTNPPESQDWAAIQEWRGAQRLRLQQQRQRITRADRIRLEADIHALLRQHMVRLRGMTIGFYWPIKGEIDLRALMLEFVEDQGAVAALPVVTQRFQPLLFSRWERRTKMQRGDWNIPVPAKPEPVQPDILLAPLLGFDTAGYRLGFGGGYYDRTLAALEPKPLTIGIGLDAARMRDIYPQPHDIPMDAIVTESGFEIFASTPTTKHALTLAGIE